MDELENILPDLGMVYNLVRQCSRGSTCKCSFSNSFFWFSSAVDDSAILDCQFSEFYHTPPPGFEKILFEQQIF